MSSDSGKFLRHGGFVLFIDPRQKLFQHLDRLAALKAGEIVAPINVEIDLSNRCSLGCEWCHFGYTHSRGPLARQRQRPAGALDGGDLMPLELARRLLRELKTEGVRSVTWTGGGEPTLHPDFDDVVTYAYARGIPQGVYTNGAHITPGRAQLLRTAMTFVYVSLDAADAVAYKRDKRVDRFDQVMTGIGHLAAASGPAAVGVGFLLTRENWQDAPRMRTLARESGSTYCQFRPTILYTQDDPGKPAEDTGWMLDARQMLEELREDEFVIVDVDRFAEYANWSRGYSTCYWSALQTVVTPNGRVWTCVNKREHPAALLGELNDESFAEIWARRPVAKVDGSCRLMCRGHLANQSLAAVMEPVPHAEFV